MLRCYAGILSLVLTVAIPGTAAGLPNIVFVLFDDVGYADFGVTGSSLIETPEIDRLASEGMRFTRYYTDSPLCSPTRAAILTGIHPSALGLRRALAVGSRRGLPADLVTLPEILGQAGYTTGHFGKWHVGRSRPEHLPTRKGFDRSVIRARNDNGHYFDRSLLIDDLEEVETTGHVTDIVTDHVLAFIEENRDRPFFANVWYNNAHRPYEAPARWSEHYSEETEGQIAALISHGDEQVGRILARLRDLGLEDDTIVVVTSDNGGTGASGPTGIFRGKKGTVWEGGIRVPAIVKWPGRIPAGAVNESLIESVDWLSILTGLASLETPDELPVEGNLIQAMLSDQTALEPGTLFWEVRAQQRYFASPSGSFTNFAARDGGWKLLANQQTAGRTVLLFDLDADPSESNDLAAVYPARVEDLLRQYRTWRLDTTRIGHRVALIEGDAAVESGTLTFGGNGAVILEANDRYDVDDGAFTFQARVALQAIGPDGHVIVSHPGSWELSVESDGRLLLEVREAQSEARTFLVSEERLAVGSESDVAFTIFGWANSPSTVRLMVDGRLQAETNEIQRVGAGTGALRLGSDTAGGRALVGTVRDPAFYLASLTPDELQDADSDGVVNSRDNCSGELNPQQIDSDLDGYGNACDADYDNSGRVGFNDFPALRQAIYSKLGDPAYRPELDSNGDGTINNREFAFYRSRLGQAPGPSGLACAGAAPCVAP